MGLSVFLVVFSKEICLEKVYPLHIDPSRLFNSIQTGTHLSRHKSFLLHRSKINTKGEQLQEPLPRLIQDDTGEAGNHWVRFEESLVLTLFVSVNGEESHCCFTEGLCLSGGMSTESKARREGEEDRWLGLWTQQRPPLILHWVSICFASLPKAITQLPFFHPFLWEPLAFFLPCQSLLSAAVKKSGL